MGGRQEVEDEGGEEERGERRAEGEAMLERLSTQKKGELNRKEEDRSHNGYWSEMAVSEGTKHKNLDL